MIRFVLWSALVALCAYAVIGMGTAAQSTVKHAHAKHAQCIALAEQGMPCKGE